MTTSVRSYRFGHFDLRPAPRQLLLDGQPVSVGARAFDMLLALIERHDRVVGRDELFDLVWPGLVVEENNLRQQVSALRKLIGAASLLTVPGRGYRFGLAPQVEREAAATAGYGLEDPPAPAQQAEAPNNLPLNLPVLIGRDQDLASVLNLLARAPVLTLVGAGGVGKTRFALELAATAQRAYRHGVWFVELAPVADPALLPQAVASALGVHEETGRPLLQTLLDYLRQRELLIVLDNCEHLVESCAQFVEQVLRTSAKARTLATSREALGIAGEVAWRVPSLRAAEPGADRSAEHLLTYAATQLFVQRATAASPLFQLSQDNAAAVAQICYQLDGIPLALELAAARVKAMRVEQVAERLGDRFALLSRGSRTALQRHQTLRSLIDWSHELLSEPERVLLRRLSVFAGGWGLEAAEAVCSDECLAHDQVLDLLSRLVEKSLVLLDDQSAAPRYRMLETIRQYAHEKLTDSADEQALNNRHLAHMLRFAEAAEPNFFHPDQLHWYASTDAELDNVRAALEWSLGSGQLDCGLRIANALHRYWVARLYWREATGWLDRLLALPNPAPQGPLRAKALFVAGHIANYYDPATAQRLTEESLRLARALEYTPGIVNALWVMGWIHNPRLDGSAAPLYAESIELATAIDYPFGAVHAYAWYGMYKVAMGDYEAAKPLLRAGIEWAHRMGGDASLIGRCKGNLAQAEMLQGHFEQARQYLDESWALQVKAGNRNGTAESLWLQGRLALCVGDPARALSSFRTSLGLYRPYATSLWVTRGLAYLMMVYASTDRLPLATQLAGFLAARDGGTGRLKAELGSLAAIAEYEAAIAEIHHGVLHLGLRAEWDAGQVLTDEAAIAIALDETSGVN
jgi:predicted ATPase/DNA-binding winged helix-turn-helix (wHTH) protein